MKVKFLLFFLHSSETMCGGKLSRNMNRNKKTKQNVLRLPFGRRVRVRVTEKNAFGLFWLPRKILSNVIWNCSNFIVVCIW